MCHGGETLCVTVDKTLCVTVEKPCVSRGEDDIEREVRFCLMAAMCMHAEVNMWMCIALLNCIAPSIFSHTVLAGSGPATCCGSGG